MDTCLPESPSWSVVFPVVMPVSSAVCSKAIHVHLGSKRELVSWPGKQLVFISNVEETLLILSLSTAAPGDLSGMPSYSAAWDGATTEEWPRPTQGTLHLKLCWDHHCTWTQTEKEISIHEFLFRHMKNTFLSPKLDVWPQEVRGLGSESPL